MRHRFSSPEIELKHSFQTFKKHFITFYNDVYGGSVEEYVEGLPDSKRRAIYNEMTNLLKNVKRLDKVIMKMKETNMRLSKLSDRQLRRLIRNAEVRFGEENENLKKDIYNAVEKYRDVFVKLYGLKNRFEPKLFRQADQLKKFDPKTAEEMKNSLRKINRLIGEAMKTLGDFKEFTLRNKPII